MDFHHSSNNILDTIAMIEKYRLDIRTVTMGISLLGCMRSATKDTCTAVYDTITRRAENLVSECEKIERELGIPIVNKRISVTPVALITSREHELVAHALDEAAKAVGVNFIGGYSALVEKGMSESDSRLIASIPEALASAMPFSARATAADALALVHNRQPLTRTPPTLAQYRAAVEQNDTGWAEVVLATDDDSCDLMVSGRRVVPPERVCALQSDHPTYMETGRLSADGSRVLFDGDHGDRMPAVLDLESHGFLAMPPAPTRAEKDGANVRPTLVSSSLLVTFDDDDRTLRGYDLTAG